MEDPECYTWEIENQLMYNSRISTYPELKLTDNIVSKHLLVSDGDLKGTILLAP